jgi:hypothetical protein
MPRNPFLEYLETHPRADALALKELFRILAKRTHPDLTQATGDEFVALQHSYHEAVELLLAREDEPDVPAPGDSRSDGESPSDRDFTSRERVLSLLYRYKAALPTDELQTKPLPPRCVTLLAAAVSSAADYQAEAHTSLQAFQEHFHHRRTEVARYPDVRTKYIVLLRALHSFFDYQVIPNDFNLRVCRSYLLEIRPVEDYDPQAPPELRTNRSAHARSALYQMRRWLGNELSLPVCRVL